MQWKYQSPNHRKILFVVKCHKWDKTLDRHITGHPGVLDKKLYSGNLKMLPSHAALYMTNSANITEASQPRVRAIIDTAIFHHIF